ncbi:MAG: hypothetical protein K0R79_2709, partial [Stenotrophomonas indicatrix]|nr:hypothetical protein [Stenotrophomonas indicatrix]
SIHVTLGVGSGVQLLGVTSPWGLGSRIHAADTPHSDTAPPLTDFRDLVDPRHAWMNLHRNRIFRYWIEEHPRMAWIYVSTKVDTYQSRKPFRQIAEICRRRGGSGCGGVRGMDAAAKPPGMGLRRPPQSDPPRLPTECTLLLLLLLWLVPWPRQVQGCKPCRTPLNVGVSAAPASPTTSTRARPGDGPAPAASAGAGWPDRRLPVRRRLPGPIVPSR